MILGEYLTAREMMAVEMNSAYLGFSTLQMMENAGKSVAEAVKERFPPGSSVDVICGLSGNGGDGFVAARHLGSSGYNVSVYVIGEAKNIRLANSFQNYQVVNRWIDWHEHERKPEATLPASCEGSKQVKVI